jgi:CheY-like chemotaxis protein
VFVIDDDDSVRRALERLLRSDGLDVESFGSPKQFLARPVPDRHGDCQHVDLQSSLVRVSGARCAIQDLEAIDLWSYVQVRETKVQVAPARRRASRQAEASVIPLPAVTASHSGTALALTGRAGRGYVRGARRDERCDPTATPLGLPQESA